MSNTETPSREFTPKYSTEYWTKGLKRLNFNYKFYQAVIGVWVRSKFHFEAKTFKPKSKTFLAVTNHTNDLDSFFFPMMFPDRYARFVAAESIIRKPVIGPLVSHLQRPIPRKKGESGAEATYYIRENLKNGVSVFIFPEGVRTSNGRTGFISPRTADLVKDTGCGLITTRIYGGYLSNPLWSKYKRKGHVHAEMVREYTAEELAAMTSEEIYDCIVRDTYVNAYDVQRKEMIPYPGEKLAEGLENVLYLCPACRKIDTLRSEDDNFTCTCGLHAKLDEYGFFRGEDLPFDNVCDWETWQRETLKTMCEEMSGKGGVKVCSQEDINLTRLDEDSTELLLESAEMTLYSDSIVFESGEKQLRFPLSGIDSMSNFRSSALIIHTGGCRYEVRHGSSWPVFKYIALYRLLTGRKYL